MEAGSGIGAARQRLTISGDRFLLAVHMLFSSD
jgi:hypothetical protein